MANENIRKVKLLNADLEEKLPILHHLVLDSGPCCNIYSSNMENYTHFGLRKVDVHVHQQTKHKT